MRTLDPLTPNAIPAEVDRIIQEKTQYWQNEAPAVNHLAVSGVRPRPIFAPIYKAIASLIPAGSKVLDVGCGHGRLSIPLAESGFHVVATDVSAKMLALLKEHKGDLPIEIRQGDAHRLAAQDGEFDVVLSYDFMPHFPDWPRLLGEKVRACRRGGRVLFAFNFSEHREYARPFGGDNYEHPYSSDPNSSKPFWAETRMDEMLRVSGSMGLRLLHAVPLKVLNDNYAFGGALGSTGYRGFQAELSRRLEADPRVAEFFEWLEAQSFQRLPYFAAYSSLLVFERTGETAAESPSLPSAPSGTEENLAFLHDIPSETTPGERLLLHRLFKASWNGLGKVVEIGPFLGGTTRAIAAGMLANPARAPGAELHTFDRFGTYYTPDALRRMIEPLVRCGALPASQADALCATGDFLKLFEAIHSPHPYFQLLRVHHSPLPDLPEDVDNSDALAVLDSERDLGALFIDGCKSWASTHYAMKFLLPRTQSGAPVIFQDFGWYTCFWISSFVHALRGVLEPVQRVDATYVFRLARPVTAEEIGRRFPKTPGEMGVEFFRQASDTLLQDSQRTGDRRGELIALLHLVAALATLGRKPEAAAILKRLDVGRYREHVAMIQGCIQSPTYLPGGKQIVWTER